MTARLALLLFVALGTTPLPITGAQLGAADAGKTLQQGRAALTAGNTDAAVAAADSVLSRSPGDVPATALKIDALVSAGMGSEALAAYEAWFAQSRREEASLLRPVARWLLLGLSTDQLPVVRVSALEGLAQDGDAAAAGSLGVMARSEPASDPGWRANLALARMGHAESRQVVLAGLEATRGMAKVARARAASDVVPSQAAAAILDVVKNGEVPEKFDALLALVPLRAKSAIPLLREVARTGHPMLRLPARCALLTAGDRSSATDVTGALESPVPSVKLMAAGALARIGNRSWPAAIRPLLKDPDGINRLLAAELLLGEDREAALDVLGEASRDTNPAVRDEAARILAASQVPMLGMLRPLLHDRVNTVRLQASLALFKAGAKAERNTRPPRRRITKR